MPSDLVAALLALAGWGSFTAVALAATRFGVPAAGPARAAPPDDLPPGVVAHLTGGRAADAAGAAGAAGAATATLLDLAARGALVVQEPAGDPAAATVRPGTAPVSPDRLESLVLDRVAALGRGGPVPLAALAVRAGERDDGWSDDVRAAVVADARARGLSRPRAGLLLRCGLVAAALVPAATVGVIAAARSEDRSSPLSTAFACGSVVLVGLLLPTWRRFDGERLTRPGRRAAAAWRGYGRELGRDELLRAARPASVGSWGRRLAYAQALGLARGVAGAVRLGPGDRHRVWSSYGGRWREVEVRYPRGPLVGRTAPSTALVGGWLLAVLGATVFALFWVPAAFGVLSGSAVLGAVRAAGVLAVLATAAVVLLRVAAALPGAGGSRTVVGEVVWLQEHHTGSTDSGSWVEAYHVAVDDGTSDRTTAWSLPAELRDGCATGDHVRLTVRPGSRVVQAIERVTS